MSGSSIVKFQTVVAESQDGLSIDLMTTDHGLEQLHLIISPKALDKLIKDNPGFKHPGNPVVLAQYDADSEKLTVFPLRTLLTSRFLEPKYTKIRSIVVDGISSLEHQDYSENVGIGNMPAGLVRAPLFGFGVLNDLRTIVQAVERVPDVTELYVSKARGVSQNGGTLRISRSIFDGFRKTVGRLHRKTLAFVNERKLEVIETKISDLLQAKDSVDYHDDVNSALADRLAEALVGKIKSGTISRKAALQTVRASVANIAKTEPTEILSLQREIETVTLEDLIERMEKRIAQKGLTEHDWQSFLSANAFILRAFGVPALVFEEQLAVGGTRFDGGGGKLADYAIRAGLLGNLAIIEIKRSSTDLVERKAYRGDLHAPSTELSGAVSQVLDQRYRLQMDIKSKKIDSGIFDVYTYAVQCIVIAGLTPESEPMRKSFELYRNSLKEVLILTFDELLAKLRALLSFLKGEQTS
ncbi:hypothetical protein RGR602_PA00006 (plasmid) [Rhizobium gallicum bv. gallicum R602sp]|uniref:Shedu protein SduA C-terminal domain-containing protein n=2 Tax=Rhizobium TaxID=379 RepID=A0A0B4X9Q3_9HYPH|nr:Shedu immune nuclease family protein [Rhizobium gallicum]AJD43353.1 hypothetical protein RGR602_PA00006 [Rhizobium gallicum bv. gallicum R602sp]TDW26616.1 uncharacterized protein DUF4263 [Rhizobium azibense]